MKRLFSILLSVIIVFVTGCGTLATDNEDSPSVNSKEGEVVETAKDTAKIEKIPQKESEEKSAEDTKKTAAETVKNESIGQSADGKETSTEKPRPENSAGKPEEKPEEKPGEQPEQQQTEPPQPVQKPEKAAYDPKQVVSLAIAKCQAGGMITTQDNLMNALNEGRITQEEYNEYYPYDGLENSYYSVFVENDLNIAATISGRRLGSVEEIADHIAGMLLLEVSPVFNIIYAGVYTLNGTDYYEFRCLR